MNSRKAGVVIVPQNRPPPNVRRAVVAVLGLVLALVLAPVQHAAADEGHDTPLVPDSPVGAGRQTPITAADRDLVVRVRLAGLWEMPAGSMAATKGVNPVVRRIGREITSQHGVLDRLTREAAGRLGVPLPDRPTPEQLEWLGEMQRATGSEFDRVFVLRLRVAHGAIFPAIGSIRAGTHNDVVRRLAQQANQFVMTHLTLLESTGLVDYNDDVPKPPDPAPLHLTALAPVEARAGTGGAPAPLIWTVLAFALLAGGVAVARVVRPR
jgi:predicted outer membrane protein